MKKYYFMSFFNSFIYLIISVFLSGLIVLCCFSPNFHSGHIFVITLFSICISMIMFWFVFSLSMRIEVDYEKKELYIRQPYFIKRMKFEDIKEIQIIDYNEVAFDFVIVTEKFTRKMAYARYLKRRPNPEIKAKLDELKSDFMKISNKEY